MTEAEFYVDTNAHLRARVAELERELDAERQRRFDGNRIASEEAREELAAVQAVVRRLQDALSCAIEEADGWCDESRGEPCGSVDWCRPLLESQDDTALREMIEAARAEEREACAQTCEDRDMRDNTEESFEALRCAEEIRARSAK